MVNAVLPIGKSPNKRNTPLRETIKDMDVKQRLFVPIVYQLAALILTASEKYNNFDSLL